MQSLKFKLFFKLKSNFQTQNAARVKKIYSKEGEIKKKISRLYPTFFRIQLIQRHVE